MRNTTEFKLSEKVQLVNEVLTLRGWIIGVYSDCYAVKIIEREVVEVQHDRSIPQWGENAAMKKIGVS